MMNRTIPLLSVLAFLNTSEMAHACACCAVPGERFDRFEILAEDHIEGLNSLRFDSSAHVFTIAINYPDVVGIRTDDSPVSMEIQKDQKAWNFVFHNPAGQQGELNFSFPKNFTSIGIDTRDPEIPEHTGGGPSLYREWRLTTKSKGNGIIQDSVDGVQTVTLVLQGRGNSCGIDVNGWSLQFAGTKSDLLLFGEAIGELSDF